MHTVVMKYFRYDMRCIVDRWDLNVSFTRKKGDGQNERLRTFRMFLHLVAGEVVGSYLLNVYGLLGKSDQ